MDNLRAVITRQHGGAWLTLILSVTLLAAAGAFLHRSGGSALAGDAGPVGLLGQRAALATGCHEAELAVGDGTALFCADFSAIVVSDEVQVVSLYAEDGSVVEAYQGRLPEGVAWGETLVEVRAALGEPTRITDMYGPPTLVYSYAARPYGSLELQFDAHLRLVRINAELVH